MFKEKVLKYLTENQIVVSKVEQEEEVDSLVCHIDDSLNDKIESIKEKMEKDLDVYVVLSGNYGMNVVIIESKNLE